MPKGAILRQISTEYADTARRFPLTIVLLLATFIANTIAIYKGEGLYGRLVVTFLLGATLSIVLQLIFEKIYTISTIRYLLQGTSLVLSSLYYLAIGEEPWSIEVTVKTSVLFFIILVAFIWIPSIKSSISFNESFMAAFKGFFMTAFFHIVLYLGVVIIISATNLLLMRIPSEGYAYAANIIFVLLAPIYYISLIPYYPNLKDGITMMGPQNPNTDSEHTKEERRKEALLRMTTPVKFLEALITYVLIPLTVVFTIILLLYIILNITGEFWTDSLMESLLVSYTITVIMVYLLASSIHNSIAKYFRLIFPKVLVVVVLFQTISSILKTMEVGITYGRYYAILFGVFATIAGVIFSIGPIHRNGLIAPILILLSLVSIFPFIDAFTIGKLTQIKRLEKVLEKNHMLHEDSIIPNSNISLKDKEAIISSLQYLNRMNYTKDIDWLREYNNTHEFKAVFGFDEYVQTKEEGIHISIYRKANASIPISGYDFMLRMNLYQDNEAIKGQFEKDGILYKIKLESVKLDNTLKQYITLYGGDKELIRFDTSNIYNKYDGTENYFMMEAETDEVTFTEDNASATLTIVAENININVWQGERSEEADITLLVRLK